MDNEFTPLEAGVPNERPVFACNLLALTAEQRQQHAQVTEQLRGLVEERSELADGYGYRFAAQAEMLRLLALFVANERLCCPFFTFAILVEPQGGPL